MLANRISFGGLTLHGKEIQYNAKKVTSYLRMLVIYSLVIRIRELVASHTRYHRCKPYISTISLCKFKLASRLFTCYVTLIPVHPARWKTKRFRNTAGVVHLADIKFGDLAANAD